MAKKAYARRYAQAAFQIALERNELEKWQSDLGKVAVLRENAALVAILESPKIHAKDKMGLLSKQLGDVSPLALNLVYLLIARGQLNMVPDIADEYQRYLDSHQGIERAEVATAVSLDDGDKMRLAESLGTLLSKKVIIKTEVNPDLLGGITVRVGGKLLDGSTRSRLEALKSEIRSAPGRK